MASLYDITKGEDIEFARIFSQAGGDAELVRAIIKQPKLADVMISAIREQLAPPMFCSPQEILGHLNRYMLLRPDVFTGIDVTAWLKQSRDTRPTDHVSSLDHLLTLDVWLGDLPTTFEALAGWIEYQSRQTGNGYWRWDALCSDAKHLRLLNPDRYGTEPSVRWVELDMLVHWDKRNGTRPRDVRNPQTSAGLQVMTAFAVHPAYPPAIDYETIPGAWLPGLQATISGREARTYVPILHWDGDNREVNLYANWDGLRSDDYAVPVVREL